VQLIEQRYIGRYYYEVEDMAQFLFASQISMICILTPCYQAKSSISILKTGTGAGFAQKG